MQKSLDLDQDVFDDLLQQIIEVRRISEENEISKIRKRSFPIPESIKYFIRRILCPDSLPNTVAEEIQELIHADVLVNQEEVERVLKFL